MQRKAAGKVEDTEMQIGNIESSNEGYLLEGDGSSV